MNDQPAQEMQPPAIPFAVSEIEASINRRFQVVVGAVPGHIAVDTLEERLTYAELDSLSDRVARAITALPGLKEDTPIALVIDQGHLAMAAVLGILKTGRGVVPLPPDSPPDHLRRLWQDALEPPVLTTRDNLELVSAFLPAERPRLVVDDLPPALGEPGVKLPEPKPEDLAVLSYTSGSTGEPKGVLWSHRLVLHTACQNQAGYHLTPQDRSAVLASFGFGAAMTQCFAALLSGATLVLPAMRRISITALIDSFERDQVSILAMPPFGLFRKIMDTLQDRKAPAHMRLVVLGGDDLFRQDVEQFQRSFGPQTMLAYRLAGSETMVMRELLIRPGMEFSTEKIPVGYAVPDKEVMLVDENGADVPAGESGEIVVRSRYLASGYWRQPDLTAAVFKPDPAGAGMMRCHTGDLARLDPAGQMEHLGRKDNMVKVRGFSVQLEAVDAALKRLDLIQDAVTLAETLPGGDRRLIAYLVPAAGRQPAVGELRERLRQSLPEHMLPAAFVWLASLPRTATGKPDRKSLPSPPRTRPQLESPLVVARNATESALAGVWQDLLRLEQVGVQDNFFELGGDSLLSVQMILEAERILKIRIPTAYFQRPTIAHLVEIGARREAEQGSPPTEPRPRRKAKSSRNPFQRSTRLRSLLRKARSGRMTPRRAWHGIRRVLSDSALAVFDGFYRRVVFRMTYTRGRHWLSRWARSPLVSRLLYREPYKLFCRLVADLEDCTVDPGRAFNASVEGNILNLSGGRALSEDESVELIDRLRASPHLFWSSLARLIDESPVDELDRHFSVTGLEHLQAAHRSGRGVIIVTYHNTSNRLAIAALPRRLDGQHIPTISQKIARQRSPNWQKNRSKKLPPADKAALYAVIALQGEHLLEEGRIIQFVSDNEYSRLEGYPVILAGRCYNLRPGFAELAVNTGAKVIPQYTGIRSGGQIHTTFLPPLDPGEGNREAQVRNLVDQYARFINDAWRIAPESLRWPRIKKHFRQPPA